VKTRIKNYLKLIKSMQTGLLLVTGIAGYVSSNCPIMSWQSLISLAGSLFLAIAGSTILNMVWDRDIDSKMGRTSHRPLVTGEVKTSEALTVGLLVSAIGIGWAFLIAPLYGAVVFAGLFIDVVVYTMWLKRRTAWAIVWGGICGGMPILAGRVLAIGEIDPIGILFALAILLWIPTHILTFNIKNQADYNRAKIPTFSNKYGPDTTRLIIAVSSICAALAIGIGASAIGLSWGYLRLISVMAIGIIALSIYAAVKPSEKINFRLFKCASLYMVGSMAIMTFGVL
jgi:heme o synthase